MPIEKLLHKIQDQIKELKQAIVPFEEETIHPSVQDCEELKIQLVKLQENLAVYKFQKVNKELSPSFNIHAMVSEKQAAINGQSEIIKEDPELVLGNLNISGAGEGDSEKKEISEPKPLAIGINDKFRFINELFAHNAAEYHIVLEQLHNLSTWHETDVYLNSLKDVYGWNDNQEVVRYFCACMKKRFD